MGTNEETPSPRGGHWGPNTVLDVTLRLQLFQLHFGASFRELFLEVFSFVLR